MKMLFRYHILFVLCTFGGLCLTAEAQPSLWNADSLMYQWQEKQHAYPMEYVYLQSDKDIYEAGEDLFFRAYPFHSCTLEHLNLSQTLYLQMLSTSDSIVWQAKYPINKGLFSGHIYLDSELPEGNYYLESYTPYSFYNDSLPLSQRKKIRVVKDITKMPLSQTEPVLLDNHFPDNMNIEENRSGIMFRFRGRNERYLGFRLSVSDSTSSPRNILLELR